jgi:hypothetical protein
VGHPDADAAAPAAKVFRFGADPGASIGRARNGSRAKLRHSTRVPVSALGSAVGLLKSRALSSAQAVLQSEAVEPFTQPLAPRDRLKSPIVSALPQPTLALSQVALTQTSEFARRRDISRRAAHAAKPKSAVPFPRISIGRNSEGRFRCGRRLDLHFPRAVNMCRLPRVKDRIMVLTEDQGSSATLGAIHRRGPGDIV